jgi:hypothetical protein
MKIYATEYISLHRITKEPVLMSGPYIEAESQQEHKITQISILDT